MPGRFDYNLISRVQEANDIVDLVGEYVRLNKKGREMVGLCPFHDDHRPSMTVSPTKQIFKCFACGAGGDALKFVQMRENLTFSQAVERLAQRAGIELKTSEFVSAGTRKQTPADDPNRLAKANAWAAKHFQQNLLDKQKGTTAYNYLTERQLTPEIAQKWQIGVAGKNGDLLRAAKEKKVPTDLLTKAGLLTHQGKDKFVNRLMFPITDATGRVVGFGGRLLEDAEGAKYVNSPTTPLFDKSNLLYGLQQARHTIVSTGTAIVVEGYMDCLMAHQFGLENVVAALGTSFTNGQARILKRYAKKVVLIFDNDAAGAEAANRALEVCLSQKLDIKIASIPTAKDPCEYLLSAGAENFRQLIAKAVDVFRFKWDRLTENLNANETIAGKNTAIDEFLETIAVGLISGNLSPIEKGLIVNRLSKIIGVDNNHINSELAKRITRHQRTAKYHRKNQKVQSWKTDTGQGLFVAAQSEVLEVLLNEPGLFEIAKEKLSVEDFDVPVFRKITELLFESLDSENTFSTTTLLTRIESVQDAGCLTELAEAGQRKGNFKPRLLGAIEVLQRRRQQMEKNRIKQTKTPETFLRGICENTAKRNPHNLGMV